MPTPTEAPAGALAALLVPLWAFLLGTQRFVIADAHRGTSKAAAAALLVLLGAFQLAMQRFFIADAHRGTSRAALAALLVSALLVPLWAFL